MPKNKKSLAETHPEIAREWHPSKNGDLTPENIIAGSAKKIWWKCLNNNLHIWEAKAFSRKRGSGCPYCSGNKVLESESIFFTHPNISKQWHPILNKDLKPTNCSSGSSKKVWWKCEKGHEWESVISKRAVRGDGCPYCSGRRVHFDNCLSTTHPQLAKEWHPTKNGKLTPFDIVVGSNKKVWWKCDKADDHEWKTSVFNRKRGDKCPVCANHKVVLSNCLSTTHPQLAKEWHPTKNGKLTPFDIVVGSNKKVWWKCDKADDHEWKTTPEKRSVRGDKCPYCTLTPQSKQELIITFELSKLFKNIDPKGFKTRLDGRLRAIDIYIPKLNLCIEFDGSYWHKNKRDIDKIKSEMLLDEGFKLIRVREEPLKKIYDTDVISKQPYNGKQVTNEILSAILSMFDLDTKMVSRIKEYQSKEDLQNEKGLDKYIDQILTEKANK